MDNYFLAVSSTKVVPMDVPSISPRLARLYCPHAFPVALVSMRDESRTGRLRMCASATSDGAVAANVTSFQRSLPPPTLQFVNRIPKLVASPVDWLRIESFEAAVHDVDPARPRVWILPRSPNASYLDSKSGCSGRFDIAASVILNVEMCELKLDFYPSTGRFKKKKLF